MCHSRDGKGSGGWKRPDGRISAVAALRTVSLLLAMAYVVLVLFSDGGVSPEREAVVAALGLLCLFVFLVYLAFGPGNMSRARGAIITALGLLSLLSWLASSAASRMAHYAQGVPCRPQDICTRAYVTGLLAVGAVVGAILVHPWRRR